MGNPKYPALTTIAAFYRILAWISIVITLVVILIGVIAAFVSGTYIGGGFLGFLGNVLGAVLGSLVTVFVYGAIGLAVAVLQLAVAEILQVVMDIEANTRS
ncbi:MAG: hypothetical protein P8X95_04345 [Anaerolineales bacterium]|jgi:hypothetical protein